MTRATRNHLNKIFERYFPQEDREPCVQDTFLFALSLRSHCIPITKFLLDEGADPNALHQEGVEVFTMLTAAVVFENFEAVQLLLSRGANVNASANVSGFSPLLAACSSGNLTVGVTLNAPPHLLFFILSDSQSPLGAWCRIYPAEA